ncbi:MAG TPA: phospholipid carrier-dependent glycosyltransferase [Planctomycetota bacterium]|nr:phospholipid carrier-dependent glycosyltransferase [Planctomycetota bacterium]
MALAFAAAIRSRPVLWLIGLVGLLYLWNLGRVELSVTDETRTGMIVRDMLSGNWLLPRTPDGYLVEKPPTFYASCALLGSIFGVNEWTLRGVSILASLGTLGVTAWFVRLFGSSRAAWLSVAALASNIIFLAAARDAMVDMMLTFFLTVGFAAYYAKRVGKLSPERATGLCGLAFGLAALTKGPLGLALPIAVCGGDLLLQTRGRFWSISKAWAPAIGVVLLAAAVSALWYVPGLLEGKGEFLETSILSENFRMPMGKAKGIGVAHYKPWSYYPLRQLVAVVPLLPLLATLPGWFRDPASGSARRLLGSWSLFGFLLFEIASNKRFYYLVTIQPAFAAMIALAADRWAERNQGSRAIFVVIGGALALAGLACEVGAFFPPSIGGARGAEIVAAIGRQRAWVVGFGSLIAIVGAAMVWSTRRGPAELLASAAAVGLLVVAVRCGLGDRFEAEFNRTRPFVATMAPRIPAGTRQAIHPPITGYSLDFYWPHSLPRDSKEALAAEYVFIQRLKMAELPGIVEILGTWKYGDSDRDVVLVRRTP